MTTELLRRDRGIEPQPKAEPDNGELPIADAAFALRPAGFDPYMMAQVNDGRDEIKGSKVNRSGCVCCSIS